MFKKLLIANRGEIACRVIRTARLMGIKTVAVYSDADAGALHVQMADEAYHLGPSSAAQSYLRKDRIVEIAKAHNVDAIHPGYGFLSENADFARACSDNSIVFVGPTSTMIEVMGSKARAKQLMAEAGVPMLPGYQGDDQTVSVFEREGAQIEYPVLLKAAAGGGGKGMRIVEEPGDLVEALQSAKREALLAFGDDTFIVEKFLPAPRHVEVQVFGDCHGNVVHLFERDCSVQRRYQKVIEEAPAPDLPPHVRDALHQAAVDAAKKVDYRGAGTVEFLFDGDEGVYFMEMNTRLQVEHPVTEEITGIDLVEWQLRVAAGERLPLRQEEIRAQGHAVEARLYAEDPSQNYIPQTGRLNQFSIGHVNANASDVKLRVDTGVKSGSEITPFYDPMIAKVIVHADDRTSAINALSQQLDFAVIDGLATNREQLVGILQHTAFVASAPTTKFLDHHKITGAAETTNADLVAGAMVSSLVKTPCKEGRTVGLGFRLNGPASNTLVFSRNGEAVLVQIEGTDDFYVGLVNGDAVEISPVDANLADAVVAPFDVRIGGVRYSIAAPQRRGEGEVGVSSENGMVWLRRYDPSLERDDEDMASGALSSLMPATVTNVSVKVGDHVEAGDALLAVEAMKMETVIRAPYAGEVTAIHHSVGDSVPKGQPLIELSGE